MKRIIPFLFLLLVLAACSADDQFRVNGSIEGKPTMNLRAGYYADGKYKTVITAVREGEFEFFGDAGQPSILEITDYDYRPIARLYVRNGQTYEIGLEQGKPYSVKASGNAENERWSAFLRENAEALAARKGNSLIESYIAGHPADVVSTLLLLTEYDASGRPFMADSLLASIDPDARPAFLTDGYGFMAQRVSHAVASADVLPLRYIDTRDSLMNFNPASQPYSLIALSLRESARRDSVVKTLRSLSRKYTPRRLGILDFSLDADTMVWKRGIRADSASWKQGWVPGGVAGMTIDALGAPALPYLIVCDSTGRQLLRTPYAGVAEKYLNSLLSK